jgi:hypothetical protein
MSYKGKYKPTNPSKYKGDPTKIVYRSLWERKLMKVLDSNPNVIEWSSEEIIVPYKSPIDGRWHRYFPDFVVRQKEKDGSVRTKMIEIKPLKEVQGPTPITEGVKVTRRYVTEVAKYAINSHKWAAARQFCTDRKWDFVILTEKELGV